MKYPYTLALDPLAPMGAARLVRRNDTAWPGGYPSALLTDDGGLICSSCTRENFAHISLAHRRQTTNGWKPAGVLSGHQILCGSHCDHCGHTIREGSED